MANSISSYSSTSNPIPCSKTTINDLPQHLLIHILTFLYLPDAIQTSRISRSFRNLWHLIPSLHFDIEEFYSRSTSPHPRCDHSRNLFVDFVSKTLIIRQPNPLTKLQLTFEYTNNDIHKYNVQSWIKYAINLSVSELVLDFRDEDKFDEWEDPDDDSGDDSESEVEYQVDRRCRFDFYLFDICKSRINVLKLYKCDLNLPPKTNPIKFVSLKSLQISDTYFGREKLVCNLLERCVNLEILKLVDVQFIFNEILVIHSSTLKELYLYGCSRCLYDWPLDLDICCPSLQKINLASSELGKVVNKVTTHLVEACINFQPVFEKKEYKKSWEKMISYFTNVTSLDVWNELLESNEVPAGCELFASNIKHLELYCSYNEDDLVGLAALLKLLPKLEVLVLNSNGTNDENLHSDYREASTVFKVPCLKKLIMRSYQNTKRELHFIKLFKRNGIFSDKIELLRPNQSECYNY